MSDLRPSRRSALRVLAGIGALAFGASACGPADPGPSGAAAASGPTGGTDRARRLGAEWESHARTFMSWPALESVWEEDLPYVRQDIARVARAIAEYEYVVMMARPDQRAAAQRACGSGVEVVPLAVDDLWARDTVPVFVEEGGKVTGVDFNFNGWGNKQVHTNDGRVGRNLLSKYGTPRVQAPLVAEGGSFETDGEGTLLITESSIVNDNRNRGKSRDRIEAELKELLGMKKVIWLKGVRGEDITDAHVDSLVRFTAPGVILLDRAFPGMPADSWSRSSDQAMSVLSEATDAQGRSFEVIDLPQPDPDRITGYSDDFLSTYANFYIGNDAVYMPRFGDRKADDRARGILQEHFPKRDIVPVKIDTIATGGGGIHCATHDQPGKPVD
ncbi:porphyromonas-type peptidyl-arginine deiminase [Streptomyces tanashiensis]|uniref:agmatine deiminase family protein n=1 Tax=Streptomyces tanashiensis TaxID=67367 RepID=UPI001679BAC9|nr:agmatine deiminase family protein [Streptomyces tanashiensis]GGS77946.1 porphyromonas-type peptidyl-arginine deiminase [Streptomyces tanashiensis]